MRMNKGTIFLQTELTCAIKLKAPPEFHAHKRQLSTISSASSSTEGSSYLGLPKRPPNKPIKPAHLKSPRRADSDISDTGSTVSPAYNKSSSASTPALGSSNPAINKLRSDMERQALQQLVALIPIPRLALTTPI